LQVPSSFKQGAARLEGVLSYYIAHGSGDTSPSLPYPQLASGQTPTHEQLVDMMASLGAATLHFYCVLYCVKGRDHSKMSDASVKALSHLDCASAFSPAMRHVMRAVLLSDEGDRNHHRATDQAVSDAAAMLPVSLLGAVRKTNSECCLWCGKPCSRIIVKRPVLKCESVALCEQSYPDTGPLSRQGKDACWLSGKCIAWGCMYEAGWPLMGGRFPHHQCRLLCRFVIFTAALDYKDLNAYGAAACCQSLIWVQSHVKCKVMSIRLQSHVKL
jgi:hypothetical protein